MRKAPRRIAGTAQAMRKTHLYPMFTIARAKRRAAGKAFRVFFTRKRLTRHYNRKHAKAPATPAPSRTGALYIC